jgi:hypothetical protein
MSLINDALKKAQRERTGGAPATVPVPGGGSRPPIEAQSRAERGPQLTLLVVGALAGMVLAGGAVWWLVSRTPSAPETATPAAPSAARTVASPTATADRAAAVPAVGLPALPERAGRAESIASGPSGTGLAPAAGSAIKFVVSSEPPAPRETTPPVVDVTHATPPATPALPTLSPAQLAEIVDAFRVAGIRPAGADSKVLLNDRVYRIGDIVDIARGIRLTAVTANYLTFTGPSGLIYTRNF